MATQKKIIKSGFVESFPLAIAIAIKGLSFGVLATQAKFSLVEILAMSIFIFSGSVQMVTVAMVAGGASLTSVLLTATLLNLRNILYGASLAEGLSPAKKWRWLLSMGVSDEPFVLGSARFNKYGPDPLYFGVVAGCFYLAWIMSSLTGSLIGTGIAKPEEWGLDLAFPITFVALLIPGIKEKPVVATAIIAAIMVIGLEYLIPDNQFSIIIAGFLAPFVGIYYLKRGVKSAE
ncbi:4-azaleucine resistance probable transporter AzlC [Marininema mesophilum]|uniref:4-azaleucine resistance probable transporter AzlC n=1 Tax=Marininema mesophilum TaxID=1048340 RepID=A0A1H3BJ55_9BACL|nr:AzlC family ABC transporter permease [Marininema mesophilum]SDX41354.1 4-azaleucine resistance probable transporter AzlC [Marininema mesophilum]